MISKLHSAGFFYSEKQVEKAIRKEGPFAGFAEYIFIPSFRPETLSILKLPEKIVIQHENLYDYLGSGVDHLDIALVGTSQSLLRMFETE